MTDFMEKSWEIEYYHETDRKKRKKILEGALAAEGMSPENELRSKLLEARYGKSGSQDVDYFLRGLVSLKFLDGGSRGLFGKKKKNKGIEKIMSDWRVDLAESYGTIGRKVLYQEFCNLALVYIKLCREDRNYTSMILGMGKMKEETITNKIGQDMFNIAYELPAELDARDQLKIFTEAMTRMFFESFPEAEDAFRDKIAAYEA